MERNERSQKGDGEEDAELTPEEKGGACACRLKFWKQMILSEQSCWIRTRELEEEALRNDWTIETNHDWEGRKTAIPRMDHTTGAAKIPKQTKWSDWRGLISTLKIEVESYCELRKIIIAQSKSTVYRPGSRREGTEGNTRCWKNWGHSVICRSLHMKVIARQCP